MESTGMRYVLDLSIFSSPILYSFRGTRTHACLAPFLSLIIFLSISTIACLYFYRNRIHISEDTARFITDGGKDHWLTPREEKVQAKGKGQLTTFFVFEKKDRRMSCASTSSGSDSSPTVVITNNLSNDRRRRRLIDWHVDLFAGSIRKIVARRGPGSTTSMEKKVNNIDDDNSAGNSAISDGMVLDEVVEIIELPAFDPKASTAPQIDPQLVHIDEDIMMQLRNYIFAISNKYNENRKSKKMSKSNVMYDRIISKPAVLPFTFIQLSITLSMHHM
jgi:hypothetical protein